ncbi:signal transduction response regulator, skn7 [Paramyrothecium foliicola]|nr:signal transduction response regulator, skn7 [Paramyrothecium foliicola]
MPQSAWTIEPDAANQMDLMVRRQAPWIPPPSSHSVSLPGMKPANAPPSVDVVPGCGPSTHGLRSPPGQAFTVALHLIPPSSRPTSAHPQPRFQALTHLFQLHRCRNHSNCCVDLPSLPRRQPLSTWFGLLLFRPLPPPNLGALRRHPACPQYSVPLCCDSTSGLERSGLQQDNTALNHRHCNRSFVHSFCYDTRKQSLAMSGTDAAAAQGSGNNASEFGEKFTRSILPKHFKHSNMSSFIRQLNKYDFHKVKPSSDSETSSPNGNVLEFKHPYFRVDSKDDLDNIRRKAPAPRKPQATEDFTTSHHISVISEQLAATQQQVQQLQELFADVSQTNKLLVNEVLTLQKMLNAQKQAQYEMLNYLTPYENRNDGMNQSIKSGGGSAAGDMDDGQVPELRRARELLSSVAPNSIADRELERLHGVYGSPADSGAMITPTSMPMIHDPMTDISRYPIYPVGQTVGIDPFHSDHIHKIPYAIPNDVNGNAMQDPQQAQAQAQQQPQIQQAQQPQPIALANGPSQSTPLDKSGNMWGPKKPLVFLVEDDNTCSKIGIKFLKSMGCEVEHAPNGAEAYQRVSEVGRDHFDLIFMDIIMPQLDGVSATLYIRQHYPSVPIIAMTSNIRPEEVNGYFEHGMNGVLAKPFTREGMLKSVKTHLSHLLKNPPPQNDHGSGFLMGNVPFIHTPGTHPLKFDSPTPPSGNPGSTWSPGQMPPTSALSNSTESGYGLMNGGAQFNMPQSTSSRANYSTTIDGTPGRLSDHDSPPEKRQRLNTSHNYM